MNTVYVLTEESNDNALIGVYTTFDKAMMALWYVCGGYEMRSMTKEEVGWRLTVKGPMNNVEMYYIEKTVLDDMGGDA